MIRRNRVDHFTVAAACRANPGEWQPVGEYNSGQSAAGAAGYISNATVTRSSLQSAYSPAGSFETRQTLTEHGARVEARYIGVSDDVAWTDALTALSAEVTS